MIEFNIKDYNLSKIAKHCQFDGLNGNYYVYGVPVDKQKGYSAITIGYDKDIHSRFHNKYSARLLYFFKMNRFSIQSIYGFDYKNIGNNLVEIGIRSDVQKNVELSAAILKTIIFVIENKIQFGENEYGTRFNSVEYL